MVERARAFNRHGDRVEYLENARDDLSILADECFDFVYSSITLQHIPPEPAGKYIREFFRVLKPGGIAVFQVPDGKPFAPGTFAAWLYKLRRQHLRRLWKQIRGLPPVEMHYVPRIHVEQYIDQSGGELVKAAPAPRKQGKSLRYFAVKSSPPNANAGDTPRVRQAA
jgi:ubiquinone/menaquinone biosynthesis C-methylase UbiE